MKRWFFLIATLLARISNDRSTLVEGAADPSFPSLQMADPRCSNIQPGVEKDVQDFLCRNTVFFPNYCRSYCNLCQDCENLYPNCIDVVKSTVCTNFNGLPNLWSCDSTCPFINITYPDDTVIKNMQNLHLVTNAWCPASNLIPDMSCLSQKSADVSVIQTIRSFLCVMSNVSEYCPSSCGKCTNCNDKMQNCNGFFLSFACLRNGNQSADLSALCSHCGYACVVLPASLNFDNFGCFPASSTVSTSTGEVKEMKDIVVGDKLLSLTKDGQLVYSDVFVLLHQNHRDISKYYTLETEDGASITLSPEHLVYVLDDNSTSLLPYSTRVKFAENVHIGDVLAVVTGELRSAQGNITQTHHVPGQNQLSHVTRLKASRVVAKYTQYKQGLFAPVTLEGTIVVDNVIASCYAVFDIIYINDLFLTPLRLAYHFRSVVSTWIGWLEPFLPTWWVWSNDVSKQNGYGASDDNHGDDQIHWFARMLIPLVPYVQTIRDKFRGDL